MSPVTSIILVRWEYSVCVGVGVGVGVGSLTLEWPTTIGGGSPLPPPAKNTWVESTECDKHGHRQ